jgi:hypothetical protein
MPVRVGQPVFFPNRGSQRPLLLTRVGLPVFTELRFQGVRRVLGGPVKRALLFLKDHFSASGLSVSRRPDSRQGRGFTTKNIYVRCDTFDWKISFLVQICSQLFPLLPNVERLDIECEDIGPLNWQDDVDHTQWLEFFRPYIAVQILHLLGLDGLIAPTLQELTGVRVMEVLPALRSLFVTDPDPS